MFRPIRWLDAIASEMFHVASELAALLDVIQIRRHASRRQLIITLTLPQLGHTFAFSLLAIGIGGIAYVMGPLLAVAPATVTTNTAVTTMTDDAPKPAGLDKSIPVKLRVPNINIDTELITLGKNADGTLATPDRYDIAGWYEYAPTPGEVGPAIIVGHVDNYLGPAVFFNLKSLQPGQSIFVTRQDERIVEFLVDSVELFDQQNFPTAAVYGNIDYPGLRLITCGGAFNPLTGHYSHNTVVYARMRT